MRGRVLLCLIALTACSDRNPKAQHTSIANPGAALPAFQSSFVPPASGKGNFEVCLSDEADESGLKAVRLPPGTIFQSFGQMTGNLRGSLNFDKRATSGEVTDFEGSKYAVVLTAPVLISTKSPCVLTDVDTVKSDGFKFTHDRVATALHLNFQATGIYKGRGNTIANDLKGNLQSATEGGFVFGTPVADITTTQSLQDL
jgi:hypothetical protein